MGRLTFKACLLACIAALPSTNAVAACWQPEESRAAQIRSLDALLKAGAQRCAESDAGMVSRYDAFAAQHQATLETQELVLKARFMREAGIAGGQKAYDDFMAGLADIQSARLADTKLCLTVDSVTRLATEGSAADLEMLAASFTSKAIGADELCTVEQAAAPEPAAPAPAASTEPAKPAMSQQEALEAAAAALQSATAALKAAQAPADPGKPAEPAPEQP